MWLVIDEEAQMVVRGGYKYAETAGAVRSEIEYYTNTNRNLVIAEAESVDDWYAKHKDTTHA